MPLTLYTHVFVTFLRLGENTTAEIHSRGGSVLVAAVPLLIIIGCKTKQGDWPARNEATASIMQEARGSGVN